MKQVASKTSRRVSLKRLTNENRREREFDNDRGSLTLNIPRAAEEKKRKSRPVIAAGTVGREQSVLKLYKKKGGNVPRAIQAATRKKRKKRVGGRAPGWPVIAREAPGAITHKSPLASEAGGRGVRRMEARSNTLSTTQRMMRGGGGGKLPVY